MATINHNALVAYFKNLQEQHVDLADFYRFDFNEIMNKLRSGVKSPTLMLEAANIDYGESGAQSKHLEYDIAFMVMFYAKADDHDAINLYLTEAEEIVKELERRITADSENPEHWLYNRYDASQTTLHKVGPIFSSTRWGYRCTVVLRDTNTKRLPTTAKWKDL